MRVLEETGFLGSFKLAWVNSTFLYPYFQGKEVLGVLEETRFLGTFNLAWVNSTFLYPYFLKVFLSFFLSMKVLEETGFLDTFNLAWVNSTFLYPYFLKVRKGWSLIGGKASWNLQPGLGQLYLLCLLSQGKKV